MPQARFSRRRTKGDMLKSRIHFLRQKQFASKLVSSKKATLSLSHTVVTALFSFKIHLFEKPLLSRCFPCAVTDIAILFSASLTTRNHSNLSRDVLERKKKTEKDSSRTWPVFPKLAEPTHLNLSGRALVSSICADSWSIRYIHDPRFPEPP